MISYSRQTIVQRPTIARHSYAVVDRQLSRMCDFGAKQRRSANSSRPDISTRAGLAAAFNRMAEDLGQLLKTLG
jgi:hypothetical protein